MARNFDFGSGMPLPPVGGAAPDERSFTDRYDPYRGHPQFSTFRNANNYADYGHGGQAHAPNIGATRDPPRDNYQPRHDSCGGSRGDGGKGGGGLNGRGIGDTWRPASPRMPQIFRRMDDELLDYLKQRHVSPLFVNEIDLFLKAHPELAVLKSEWCEHLCRLSPLEAYRFFLKGFTRPARYDFNFPKQLTLPPILYPLTSAYDVELVDFFDGHEYRIDILHLIDNYVDGLARKHDHGFRLTSGEFKLMNYYIYGNPVDAYKYYEYSHQDEWIAHRYLPEHVVLHELPKSADYCQPEPFSRAHPGSNSRTSSTYPGVRLQMARGCDGGVDVIEVLMEEFITDLARRGFRRVEIEQLRRRAEAEIDHQRKICGSADIVDMVMSLAGRAIIHVPAFRFRAPPQRATGHRVAEMKKALEDVHKLMNQVGGKDYTGSRRIIERELVLEVVRQATRDRTMNSREANRLLALVPTGRKLRRKRGKARGIPNILRLLSRWL